MGIANATGRERGRSVSVSVSTVHGSRWTVTQKVICHSLSSAAPSRARAESLPRRSTRRDASQGA